MTNKQTVLEQCKTNNTTRDINTFGGTEMTCVPDDKRQKANISENHFVGFFVNPTDIFSNNDDWG